MTNQAKEKSLKILVTILALFFVALVAQSMAAPKMVPHAIATLHPVGGSQVGGTVTFTKTKEGIKVIADLSGLSPGKHGFHIHEWGDCSAADGTSAGGHYNPSKQPHGGPMDKKHHEGDLGNIEAQADGTAHYEATDKMLSLEGPNSIVGRSVVVHAGEDDLKSQPAGNSGPRAACGVIGYSK